VSGVRVPPPAFIFFLQRGTFRLFGILQMEGQAEERNVEDELDRILRRGY
jgi:hypothetical protein